MSPTPAALTPPHWAETALVLVAHGSLRRPEAAASVDRHAAALRARGLFAEVRTAFLRAPPLLDQTIAALSGHRVAVVPLFMCPGRAVVRDLPRACAIAAAGRAGGAALRICPPIGAHPMMAGLVLLDAERAARRRGWPRAATSLLLIAHGSPREPASRRTTEALARRLRVAGAFGAVACAFLDEPPSVPEVLARLPRPVVAIGLFAAPGGHASLDVPRLLASAGGDAAEIVHLPAIGAVDAVADVILAVLREDTTAPTVAPAPAVV